MLQIVMFDPNVRVTEPVEPAAAAGGQPAAIKATQMGKELLEATRRMVRTGTRKLVRNPVVETAGRAAPQPDVSQAQPMDVPLDQKATTTAVNNVANRIGDLRSVAGHQAVQADSMLPIEAMKFSGTRLLVSVTSMSCEAFQCDSTCEEKWGH